LLRPAENKDIPEIIELAVKSVSQDDWPLTVSRWSMRTYIEMAIKEGFCWVSDQEKIHGAVVAVLHDGFWFTEKQASLLMFYCPTGGEGYKLLRKFSSWVKEKPEVGMAVISLERFMDDRYVRMFNRLGFTRPAPTFSYVRDKNERHS
jgi:hypothetical protein